MAKNTAKLCWLLGAAVKEAVSPPIILSCNYNYQTSNRQLKFLTFCMQYCFLRRKKPPNYIAGVGPRVKRSDGHIVYKSDQSRPRTGDRKRKQLIGAGFEKYSPGI